jgi:hypothetical protein
MKWIVERHSEGFWHPIHRLEDSFESWDAADRYIDYLKASGVGRNYRIMPLKLETTSEAKR